MREAGFAALQVWQALGEAQLGGDYFGVDVNVAARLGAAAGPGEVLISGPVRERLHDGAVPSVKRR